MINLHHLLEEELGKDKAFIESEFLVEFSSRPVSHTSSQEGTERLTLTSPHVIYLKMTPQLKCLANSKTRAFEGLSK